MKVIPKGRPTILTWRGRGLSLVQETFVGLSKAVTANLMKHPAA